jgi:hypothetical protein
MSINFKKRLRILPGILSLVLLAPNSGALGQASQAGAPSSVLPTGGGAALLDPSDTVFCCSITRRVCSKQSRTLASPNFVLTS